MKKLLCAVVLAALLVCPVAAETLGAITVTPSLDGAPVSGGTVTLYYVGAQIQDGFVPAGDFGDFPGILDDIHSPALAEELAAYAVAHRISGITAGVGGSGTVEFSGLAPGLYLLVQTEAPEGYRGFAPFLAALVEGDVNAHPKVTVRIPEPELPVTGDSTPVTLLWAAACVSAGGLLLLWRFRGSSR